MRIEATPLLAPRLVEPVLRGDERGFFVEVYRKDLLAAAGVHDDFVQDNHSRSKRGVVRGMHFQSGMSKLVRCARGSIFDVVVDLRLGSPTFGRWEGYELSDENARQLYCPDGFGHGFCVLSEIADVVYKTSSLWDPALEGGFRFDDPDVGIEWPGATELVASARDGAALSFAEIKDSLPFRYAPPE